MIRVRESVCDGEREFETDFPPKTRSGFETTQSAYESVDVASLDINPERRM